MTSMFNKLLALAVLLLFCGAGAFADSAPLGQNPVSFTSANACVGGGGGCTPGTATGFFDFDPATMQVTSWDFVVTGSSDGNFSGANGGSRTYSSSDSGATWSMGINGFSGPSFVQFNFNEQNTNTPNSLQLVLNCAVTTVGLTTTNCFQTAPLQSSYALITGAPQNTISSSFAPLSGENMNVPSDTASRALGPGFLDVTDPNGIFAFNLSSTDTISTGTGGGTGGGGNTGVPEPSSVLLLGLGLTGIVFLRRVVM